VDADQKISLVEAVAVNHREHGYRFVPLVRKDWRLALQLRFLFELCALDMGEASLGLMGSTPE